MNSTLLLGKREDELWICYNFTIFFFFLHHLDPNTTLNDIVQVKKKNSAVGRQNKSFFQVSVRCGL